MAPTPAKFLPSSRMLVVSSAVFILLSVSKASELRQCYWCGPLAEQIHRSRRAPSCDAPGENITTCEPGLSHCAVVATSPPYVESRYCVKFYQDECYSLYCSSTKTWRMTCPCRGDFCNGDKTDRENEAFARLPKLVSKTQNTRIKKRTVIPSSSFISSRASKIQTTTAPDMEENEINTNNITNQNSQLQIEQNNMTNSDNETMEIKTDNELDTVNDGIVTTNDKNKIELEPTTPSAADEKTNDLTTSPLPQEYTTGVHVTKMETIINEKSLTLSSIQPTELPTPEIVQDVNKEIMLNDGEHGTNSPSATTEQTTEGQSLNENAIKPSEALPAAEALQQNASPQVVTEKPTTTESTTPMTMTTHVTFTTEVIVTTKPTKTSKNDSIRTSISLLTVTNWILLYFVI